MIRVSPEWLGLREAADNAARAAGLVSHLAALIDRSAGGPGLVIHDLGCGTGSMGRWLAPRLPGPQHWILYDRDPDLLELAAANIAERAADGVPITVETRRRDITDLTADDLRGAGLVTASALLDLLTAGEVERIAAACAGAGCPSLWTLSVTGRVELTPADPLDARIGAAFNGHQRRTTERRRLLGPDAVDAAVDAFRRHGVTTIVRSSPWRLGPRRDNPLDGSGLILDGSGLMEEWLTGWLDAACEHEPDLAGPAAAYARRRRAEAADGRLDVVVHHRDLLAHRD